MYCKFNIQYTIPTNGRQNDKIATVQLLLFAVFLLEQIYIYYINSTRSN